MYDEPSEPRGGLNEFEARLAALAPHAALDRDRVMFAAGERSVRRLRVVNRSLAVACLTLSLAIGALLAQRGGNAPLTAAGPTGTAPSLPQSPPAVRSETVLAAADAPTTFRLLRSFDPLAREAAAPRATADAGEPARPSPAVPRVLLKDYLDHLGDHL